MKITEEQHLRDQVSALMLDWAKGREPPFTGESREGFEEAILAAHCIADESRIVLHRWIEAARRSGMSWSEIGDVLGISKQAAQQRFRTQGPAEIEADDGDGEGEKVVRYGAHAFNEMAILREAGTQGHELVSVGPLQLTFRRTDTRWEYRRVISISAGLEREGWIHAASWLPFLYLKRAVD
ncbi:hypothetical protein [Porphyrobacter sp. AAP60]|uniref:hypothetical protein n=1 Tax=Porphyrobacter sp. AAP60 TaxID=1523423 RepID=UPI0006B9C982|nr:hypothetical protein [Porphyrobacter sp. AAP60]